MAVPATSDDHQLDDVARQLAQAQSPREEGQSSPPSIHSVERLIFSLRVILFARFGDVPTARGTLPELLKAQLEIVRRLIVEVVERCLSAQCSEDRQRVSLDASQLADQFLGQLPRIRAELETDIQAAVEGDPACCNHDEVILCYPGFTAVLVYRLAHQFHALRVPLLPRMMSEWAHAETGIDIHPAARIGQNFFIDHGTGVVVGATCVIGNHVKIYQGVTLGALSFPRDLHGNLVRDQKRHPTIEDRVVIYANATILGGDTVIGHDSVIGSSVWLTESVVPFTSVIMEKPRLLMRNESHSPFSPEVDRS